VWRSSPFGPLSFFPDSALSTLKAFLSGLAQLGCCSVRFSFTRVSPSLLRSPRQMTQAGGHSGSCTALPSSLAFRPFRRRRKKRHGREPMPSFFPVISPQYAQGSLYDRLRLPLAVFANASRPTPFYFRKTPKRTLGEVRGAWLCPHSSLAPPRTGGHSRRIFLPNPLVPEAFSSS